MLRWWCSCAQRLLFGFIVARQLGDPYAVALVVALVMVSAMKMRMGEIGWTHITQKSVEMLPGGSEADAPGATPAKRFHGRIGAALLHGLPNTVDRSAANNSAAETGKTFSTVATA